MIIMSRQTSLSLLLAALLAVGCAKTDDATLTVRNEAADPPASTLETSPESGTETNLNAGEGTEAGTEQGGTSTSEEPPTTGTNPAAPDSKPAGTSKPGAPIKKTDAVTLRLQPKKGATYRYQMDMAASGLGQQQNTSMIQTMKVLESSGSAVKLHVTSEAKEGAPASALGPLEDAKVTMTLTPRYQLKDLKVEGEKVDQFTENMIKAVQESWPMTYPAGAVKVGDTWTTEIDLGGMLAKLIPGGASAKAEKMKVTQKLVRFESRDGKTLAVITFSGAGSVSLGGGGQGQSIDMDQKTSGEWMIDTATGMTYSMSMKQDMTFGGLPTGGGKGAPQKMTVSNTSKMKLLSQN